MTQLEWEFAIRIGMQAVRPYRPTPRDESLEFQRRWRCRMRAAALRHKETLEDIRYIEELFK